MKSFTLFMKKHSGFVAVMIIAIIWLASMRPEDSDQERLETFKAGYNAGRISMTTSPFNTSEREQLRELCSKKWPDDPISLEAKSRACSAMGGR